MYKDTKVKRKSAMKLKVDHFKQQAEFFGKNISNSGKPRRRSERIFSVMRHKAVHPLYHPEDCSIRVPSQIS